MVRAVPIRLLGACVVFGAAACDPGIPPPTPRPLPALPTSCRILRFTAADGIALEGSFCPAARAFAPVVLYIPGLSPHRDRGELPADLMSRWQGEHLAVLAIDPRGAGESGGEADHEGDGAALDLAAALRALEAVTPAVDSSRWACVGSSHGTTPCLDAGWERPGASRWPAPRAQVWLSPGPWTERHHPGTLTDWAGAPLLVTWGEGPDWDRDTLRSRLGPRVRWHDEPGLGHGARVLAPGTDAREVVTRFLVETLAP